MDELIPGERASRDFRVKFPDDVIQDNLAGQLWFGAEVIIKLHVTITITLILPTYYYDLMFNVFFGQKKTVSHNAIAFHKICSLLLLFGLKKNVYYISVSCVTLNCAYKSFVGIHK